MKRSVFVLILFIVVFIMKNSFQMYAQESLTNASIDKIMGEILSLDQKVREDYNFSNNKKEKEALLEKMKIQDSINQSVVLPIIDKYIDGEIEELSDTSWRICFLIIQHSDLEIQLRYADFITKYFNKGFIQNYEYLIFMDRINTKSNKAQPFGSQVAELPNGKYLIFPVRPKVERDSALRKIGMDPNLFKVINGSMRYGKSVKESDLEKTSLEQYEPIEVADSEFAILGIIASDKEKTNGIENVTIKIGNKIKVTTDKNGVFSFKIPKHNIPDSLLIEYIGKSWYYKLDKAKCTGDYIIISYVIEE